MLVLTLELIGTNAVGGGTVRGTGVDSQLVSDPTTGMGSLLAGNVGAFHNR